MNYSYDANGNLTSTTAGQSFAWDVFNRMTSATGAGGTATYTYNGDGLKIRRIGPDGTTRYYYDGIRPIWEADGGGSFKAQLDRDIFGNLLSRKEPVGTRRYYHFDGLGSTTALSDEGGAAVATLLYDAWGNQRAATGATVPNYRFTGAELDTASGLYHMGARFYDPTIGRWLKENMIQNRFFEPLTMNFYAYVQNSPLSYVDPTGLQEFDPGVSGGTADERLQAFINALIAIEEFIEYMLSRGNGFFGIGGVVISIRDLKRTYDALKAAGPDATGQTIAQEFVRRGYVASGLAGTAGIVLMFVGALVGGPLNPIGAALLSAGATLLLVGGAAFFTTWMVDQILYAGEVARKHNSPWRTPPPP